jgi:hypothetical protein
MREGWVPPMLGGIFQVVETSLILFDHRSFPPRMLRILVLLLLSAATICAGSDASDRDKREHEPVGPLINWLLDRNRELNGIDFSEVILATSGKKVLAFDPKAEDNLRVMKAVSAALDAATRQMNTPGSPIQNIARINEVSSHIEDMLRELLNATAGLTCDFPRTAEGHIQRSGYPDLRIVDVKTGRVFYLDPKLYAVGSRDSSFRTFYFEPKTATNKVREDAVHLLAGFEHEAKVGGRWNFTRWDLVDLSHFKVRLKAEFQGSNRDIYRPDAIIATSRP